MPKSTTPKARSDRKTVPVKWRDSTWYPRIVIRSLDKRGSAVSLWENDAWVNGASSCPPPMRGANQRRLIRPGGRSPNPARCEASDAKAPLSYGRARFLPNSRLDNPL